MPRALHVGVVSYLNAAPLWHYLPEVIPGVEVVSDHPSVLAQRLAAGEVDVALIPSIEYLRGARELGYEVLPGIAIAAHGPVRSVKLLSRVPWQQVDRLALDEGSRTSQALARVWLDAAHGVRPRRVESLALGVSPLESTADAVLVIGDRAMRTTTAGFLASVDLSEAWNSLTGLPFVFAFWVVRPDCEFPELTLHFQLAKALGLHRVHEIAAAASLRLGLPDETCLDYLTRTLSYHLSEPEIAGFDRFHRMAALLDLAPEDVSLVWHGQRHSVTSR